MAEKKSGVDKLLLDIWGTGRWQIVQYVCCMLQCLPWAFNLLAVVPLGFTPDFACMPQEDSFFEKGNTSNYTNVVRSYDKQCSWYNATSNTSQSCRGYVYAEPKHVSIVSEWDLVCGKTYLSDMSQAMLMVGVIGGSSIFPVLSDRFGRKKTFLICHLCVLGVGVATSFLPTIAWFLGSRVILGALLYGAGLVSYVMLLELLPPVHRTNGGLVDNIFWSLCVCSLAAVGFLMRDFSWRHVQMVFAASSVIVVFQFFFVEESLRWLILNRRRKEAIKLIRKSAKVNKLSDDKRDAIIAEHLPQYHLDGNGTTARTKENVPLTKEDIYDEFTSQEETKDTSGIIDIFRHPILRKRITDSLTYMGLFMLSSAMAGDRHMNLFLNAVVDVPSTIFIVPVLKRFGRRWSCIAFHLLAGLSLILAVIIQTTTEGDAADLAVKIVVILGKLFISASFNVIFIYTPELFPTNIRASGFGLASTISRIGGLIAPFSVTLARAIPWLPGAIFGAFCLLASFLSLTLPETGDKDLPQTLADLDKPDKPVIEAVKI